MPHCLAPWEIPGSERLTLEPRASVILLRKIQKNCQERENTRENGSTRRPKRVCQQRRAHAQSIVVSGSLLSGSFSGLEVSQKCSQLIHMRTVAAPASGLETRNHFRKRQEETESYFQ